jgi:predicted Zn-dependent protease
VGDIYLEAFTANSVEGLLRALEAGLPVIACEGKTLRSGVGAAWLHSLGLDELVAGDASAYVATALRLATDVSARERVAATVKKHMARLPLLADTLAASDAFGALLETAFDRLVLEGAAAFVADRSPLRPAGLAPTDPQGRRMLGRQLLAEGRTARAVDLFMAALAGAEGIAELWLDVARALRANNQPKEAVQALETALRLDQSLVEGWQMLADLADLAMIPDLAAEARQIITSLVPTKGTSANGLAAAQPKVESIVNKLRSLRVARRGIV